MLANHAQRSLETAATKTLACIRDDRVRVARRLQPLLTHIEEHLFDPGLDVNQLKRSCGVRDNSVPIQFHAQLGLPPHAYIEEHRLRTGCRLLRDTELKIWQIADLLGYSSIQVFSRAFTRWAGMRPTGFRRKARRDGVAIPSRIGRDGAEAATGEAIEQHAKTNGSARRTNGQKTREATTTKRSTVARAAKVNGNGHASGARIEVEDLRRALDGELEATAADKLIRRLLNLYPTTALMANRPQPVAMPWAASSVPSILADATARDALGTNGDAHHVGGLLDLDKIETVRAEELWKSIKDESYEAQVMAVRGRYHFRTPALFHHLCQRSLVDGRDNRKRGVRVAELALEALEAVRHQIVDDQQYAILQGKAYAWLGNARRLAMDHLGAERALAHAQELLVQPGIDAPQELAQLLQNTAALRWNQRRFGEAADFCTRAISILEDLGRAEDVARVYLLKANVRCHLGQDDEAVSDYKRVIRLLGNSNDQYLLATAYQSLLSQLIRSGCIEESAPYLKSAREISLALPNTTLPTYLEWNEGLFELAKGRYEAAKKKMLAARDGFLDLDETSAAAIVSLDLAIMYSELAEVESVIEIATQLLPHFEARQAHGEAFVALGLLQKALASRAVTTKMLRHLRREASRSPAS